MRPWIQSSINFFALFLAIFANLYLFFPQRILLRMGFETDTTGIFFLRLIAALAAGYAVLIWTTRNAEKAIRRPVILSLLVMMSISLFVVLAYQIHSGFGIFGYFGVFMYGLALPMLGYEYIALRKSE